jgi:nucleotide-binding universal stress UspA family protein
VACQRILCAVDLKPSSAGVLDWACHLAEEYQADLTLLHVMPGGAAQQARHQARGALETLQKAARCSVSVRVEVGDVSEVVAHLAGELKADLLVIGRKPASGVLGRLEMTAYSIIRQSPCPVVSV